MGHISRDPIRIPIFLTCLIRHGGERLHTAPPPRCRHLLLPRELSLGTFNILYRKVFGIVQAIRAVQIGGFNIIFLSETKITNQDYFHNRLGYEVL